MIRGIDVSGWQGRSIDWARVKADGIAYVQVKASEGVTGASSTFASQRDGARTAGLVVGAYHFAHQAPVAAQVANFQHAAGMLGALPGELPPMLDVERSPTPPDAATAQALLDALETAWGCIPVVYGGADYLGKLGLDAHCPLMIAAYPPELKRAWPGAAARAPQLSPWGVPAFWQFADGCYDLPGAGPCDSSVWLGDAAGLAAFCAGSRV
jgi:lysozyme